MNKKSLKKNNDHKSANPCWKKIHDNTFQIISTKKKSSILLRTKNTCQKIRKKNSTSRIVRIIRNPILERKFINPYLKEGPKWILKGKSVKEYLRIQFAMKEPSRRNPLKDIWSIIRETTFEKKQEYIRKTLCELKIH